MGMPRVRRPMPRKHGAVESGPASRHRARVETTVLERFLALMPPAPMTFTAAAAAKVRELLADEGDASLKLRAFILGGGCTGFQYGFEFDDGQNADDIVIITDGASLLVDPLSLQYLAGSEVDYVESLTGAQFVIRNPNAKTTCGCGSIE